MLCFMSKEIRQVMRLSPEAIPYVVFNTGESIHCAPILPKSVLVWT